MVIELLLLSGLGASAAGIAYLVNHGVQEKKADDKRRREAESQFRASMLHKLRKSGSTAFRLSEFSAKCEIPKETADRVAEDIYSSLYRKITADGMVTAKGREKIDWLSAALVLDTARKNLIDKK